MTFLGNEVNKYPDRSGRTLLAWQRLVVIFCFMPVDLMRLYVTTRQPYGVRNEITGRW